MENWSQTRCTAFEGYRRIASGELVQVALKTKEVLDRGEQAPVLIFDDGTGEQIELDLRGTAADIRKRLTQADSGGASTAAAASSDQQTPRGPGRPKLGVVAREVTLLPRHWDWLNSQPGGASVALRKLVEEARRVNQGKDRRRRSQEAAYQFLSALAGNLPDFEEATRALFAGNPERFDQMIKDWPADVRDHARQLTGAAFQETGSETTRSVPP